MSNLSEIDIQKAFIGHSVCMENLTRCADRHTRNTNDGTVYTVFISTFIYSQDLRELFGITDSMREKWERSGVDFNLYITVKDNAITKISTDKYREVGANARPVIRPLKETQQELRIARRIIDYITNYN